MPPLDSDVLNDIDLLVRGGFEDRDRIVEILTEEMYEPGELDEDEVQSAVEAAVARHALDQQTWPAVTDCDRLDAVFSRLEAKGLIALQFAGHTQSDGFDDVSEVYQDHPDRAAVIGYCFYHSQDLERAVRGEGLYLAFGPMDASAESTEGPEVGALIAAELRGRRLRGPLGRQLRPTDLRAARRLEASVRRAPLVRCPSRRRAQK